ncbi:hypothetical protein Zmor_024992 [Zophobas morio]|uniref:Uncharacterized protein n=1 Tax=Zophobas morio TaxID=2755281 RepID=A0AA38HRA1_9CUCU|nr:hypothetical protein Zmor_024992 [Zophobas morio]
MYMYSISVGISCRVLQTSSFVRARFKHPSLDQSPYCGARPASDRGKLAPDRTQRPQHFELFDDSRSGKRRLSRAGTTREPNKRNNVICFNQILFVIHNDNGCGNVTRVVV